MELASPGKVGVSSDSVQVADVSDGWLTIVHDDGCARDFHLPPSAAVALLDAAPQRFKNQFTKIVRISSADKEELILAERPRV